MLSDPLDIFAEALGDARAEEHIAENFHRDFALGRFDMTGSISDVKSAEALLSGAMVPPLLPHVEVPGEEWASKLEEQKSGNLTEYADEYERALADAVASPSVLKQKRAREESIQARERARALEAQLAEAARALEHENARAMAADESVDEGADGADASPEQEDYREAHAAAATVQAGFRGRQGRKEAASRRVQHLKENQERDGDSNSEPFSTPRMHQSLEEEYEEQASQPHVPPPLPNESAMAEDEENGMASPPQPDFEDLDQGPMETGPEGEVEAEAVAASEAEGIDPAVAALLADYPYVRSYAALDQLYDRSGSWDLGSGANGAVSTAVARASGRVVAIKTMAMDEALDGGGEDDAGEEGGGGGGAPVSPARLVRSLERRLRDVEIQRSLSHPNIAPVLDVFADGVGGLISFVMPLAKGGSIPRYLKLYPEAMSHSGAIALLVGKMLGAVAHCHSQGILHRDLKLDNFVFDSDSRDANISLIDFGMATRCAPAETITDCLLYTSPSPRDRQKSRMPSSA